MITPVKIHRDNFASEGWATEHILVEGDTPIPDSPYVRLNCQPIVNNAAQYHGAVSMQLVPLLTTGKLMRRVQLNNNKQHRSTVSKP